MSSLVKAPTLLIPAVCRFCAYDGWQLGQTTWLAFRRGGAKGVPYIKISEAEIADDYPEPAQYEKVALSAYCKHVSVNDAGG